ncbi:hypothetical protein H6F95_07785 [Cyanobacteria bacterium FACHB-471]|nr:hypothetical protein [Cyanobacteria bacterium FACHB-471]
MNPKNFCQKYARVPEGQWGYKGQWERLLAHCCQISIKTVRTWGTAPDFESCPPQYQARLAEIDALKTVEQVLRQQNLDQDSLNSLT